MRPDRYYDHPDYKSGKANFSNGPGKCTRDPTWVNVTGSHVCGSFVWERMTYRGDYSTAICSMWNNTGELNDKIKEQSAELKRLRDANKQLRAKLKDKEPA
jgi:hypothetical protein